MQTLLNVFKSATIYFKLQKQCAKLKNKYSRTSTVNISVFLANMQTQVNSFECSQRFHWKSFVRLPRTFYNYKSFADSIIEKLQNEQDIKHNEQLIKAT